MPASIDLAQARAWFPVNVRARRDALGMSQEALARAMADLGFRYHQATVYKIESGARMVPVDEAFALGRLLRTSVEVLMSRPEAVQQLSFLTTCTRVGQENWLEVRAAAEQLLTEHYALEYELRRAEIEVDPSPELTSAIEAGRAQVQRTPESAVQDARDRRGPPPFLDPPRPHRGVHVAADVRLGGAR